MLALMMDRPLTLPSILEHAALYHGDRAIVTRTIEGPVFRYGYRDALARALQRRHVITILSSRRSLRRDGQRGYRGPHLAYRSRGACEGPLTAQRCA